MVMSSPHYSVVEQETTKQEINQKGRGLPEIKRKEHNPIHGLLHHQSQIKQQPKEFVECSMGYNGKASYKLDPQIIYKGKENMVTMKNWNQSHLPPINKIQNYKMNH